MSVYVVASGGGGQGIGIQLGMLEQIVKFLDERDLSIDEWHGTSAGAVVGIEYGLTQDPIQMQYDFLKLKDTDLLGHFYSIKGALRAFAVFAGAGFKSLVGANPMNSAIDSFLDSRPYLKYFQKRYGDKTFHDLLMYCVTYGYNITLSELVEFTSNDSLARGAYVSSAQPPFIAPAVVNSERLISSYFIDGGLMAVLPIEKVASYAKAGDEIWVMLTSTALRPNPLDHGLLNHLAAALDSCVAENLRSALELVTLLSERDITVHFIDGTGYPRNLNGFTDFFKHRKELIEYGRTLARSYITKFETI